MTRITETEKETLDDEIVTEIRAARKVYAKSLGYDVKRILKDLQRHATEHSQRIVTLPPRLSVAIK
jgi:hypothetical protein